MFTLPKPNLLSSVSPLQNTNGVEAVHIAPTDFVRRQIAAVLGDIGADVVKTGMLPTPEVRRWLFNFWAWYVQDGLLHALLVKQGGPSPGRK